MTLAIMRNTECCVLLISLGSILGVWLDISCGESVCVNIAISTVLQRTSRMCVVATLTDRLSPYIHSGKC